MIKTEAEKIPVHYREYRCKGCEKLLFKGMLVGSEIEVKCKRCGKVNVFVGVPEDSLLCFVSPCPYRIARPVKK